MSQFDRYEPCNDGKVLVTGKVLFGSKKDVDLKNLPFDPRGSSILCKDYRSTVEALAGYYVHGKVFVAHDPSSTLSYYRRESWLHVVHHENIDGFRLGELLCMLKGYGDIRSRNVINRYDWCHDLYWGPDDDDLDVECIEEESKMDVEIHDESSESGLRNYVLERKLTEHEIGQKTDNLFSFAANYGSPTDAIDHRLNEMLLSAERKRSSRKRDRDAIDIYREEKKTRMKIEDFEEESGGEDYDEDQLSTYKVKIKSGKEKDWDIYFRPLEGGNQFRLSSFVNETGWYYGAMLCDPVSSRVYAYIFGDVFVFEEAAGEVESTSRQKTDFFIDPTALLKVLPGQKLITNYFQPKSKSMYN